MRNSMLVWEVNSRANQLRITIFDCQCVCLLTVLFCFLAQLAWGSVVDDLDHIFAGNGFTKTVTLNYDTAKEVVTLDKYIVV